MRLVFVLDCADPDALANFWAAALNYDREPLQEPYVVLKPRAGADGPELILQRVAEPKMVKNRMHLDMRVDDLAVDVERLVELGAAKLGNEIEEYGFRWYVMIDPEATNSAYAMSRRKPCGLTDNRETARADVVTATFRAQVRSRTQTTRSLALRAQCITRSSSDGRCAVVRSGHVAKIDIRHGGAATIGYVTGSA